MLKIPEIHQPTLWSSWLLYLSGAKQVPGHQQPARWLHGDYICHMNHMIQFISCYNHWTNYHIAVLVVNYGISNTVVLEIP